MFKNIWRHFVRIFKDERGVFWALPLALAALGAGVGAATNKKNPGKSALKGALLGAGLGMGVGALGTTAGLTAGGAGGATAASQAGNITSLGGGKLGLMATGEGSKGALLSSVGSGAAKQGILKGFMSSELGKGMMQQMGGQLAGSMLGEGPQTQQAAEVGFPSMQAQYNANPLTTPLTFASPQGQMQQEIMRRRMMGYGY